MGTAVPSLCIFNHSRRRFATVHLRNSIHVYHWNPFVQLLFLFLSPRVRFETQTAAGLLKLPWLLMQSPKQ